MRGKPCQLAMVLCALLFFPGRMGGACYDELSWPAFQGGGRQPAVGGKPSRYNGGKVILNPGDGIQSECDAVFDLVELNFAPGTYNEAVTLGGDGKPARLVAPDGPVVIRAP